MGDVLSFCCESLEEEEGDFEGPQAKPTDIYGREWHVLAKQLKDKRNAAIQASNKDQQEATHISQNVIGDESVYDEGEARAKAHQILLLHQAMRSARSAHREQRRLQKIWRDVDRDVLESIEL